MRIKNGANIPPFAAFMFRDRLESLWSNPKYKGYARYLVRMRWGIIKRRSIKMIKWLKRHGWIFKDDTMHKFLEEVLECCHRVFRRKNGRYTIIFTRELR